MAELRTGGACALPQCSLVSVPFPSSPGRCCSSSSSSSPLERFGDVEQQGLRFNARRFKHQSERMIRTRLPAVAAAGSTSENDVEVGTRKFPGTAKIRKKGDNVVFVAGATGKVGSRTVKELLKLGLQVRAGVRDVEKAKSVLEESIQLSAKGNPSPFVKMLSYLGFKQEDRLEFVNCDLENAEEIETALGNAGVVVCAVGASEKEVLDVTGPYRIDYQGTKNLITAARNSKVRHFVLLTSLGTTKFGWPAAVLNLFWGVLVWKAKAEKALVDSGLVYTIVRPGGMERPTDSYKETHNLRLGAKDAFTGGQISRLQVAELLACIASNLELSENKILEAIAETSAPRRPIIELLEEIPSQTEDKGKEKDKGTLKVTTKKNKAGSERPSKRAEEDQKAEAALKKAEKDRKEKELKQQQAEEEAKSKAIEAKQNQELREKIATELATLKKQEEAAVAEVEKLQKKRIELTEKAKAAAAAAAKAEALAKALLGAAKQGKLLSEDDKQKVVSAAEATKTSSKDAPKTTNAEQELKAKINPEPKPRKASIVPPKPVKVAEAVKKVAEPETKKEPETSASSSKPAKTSVTKVDEPETPKKSSSISTSATLATKTKPDIAIAKPTSKEEPPSSQESEKPKQIKAEVEITSDKPEQSTTESRPATAKNEKVDEPESKEKESKPAPGEKDSKAEKTLEEEKPSSAESSKPFRWFWQQPEVESNVVDETAIRSSEQGKPAARPLSPYYRYPDLKPPPSPRPPSFDKVELTSNSETVDSQEALPKPNTVFRWPWQREEKPDADVPEVEASSSSSLDSKTSNTPTPEESVPEVPPSEQKKEDKVIASVPEVSTKTQKKEVEVINVPAKDEEKQIEVTASLPKKQEKEVDDKAVSAEFDPDAAKERELAALAKARAANAFVWPWLSSSSAEETKDVDKQKEKVEEKVVEDVGKSTNSKPLSPFGRYADLKPPSTPSPPPPEKPPTAPSPRPPKVVSEKVPTAESKTTEVSTFEESPELQSSEVVKSREEAAVAKAKASLAWPWRKDLNSDGAAAVSKEQSSNATGTSTPAVTSSISAQFSAPVPVSRPLSPYTRYADLKPPSSPTPAPPRITTAAAQDVDKVSKRPSEAASSAVDEAAEEARARAEAALEKARASIKWTWS